ncbi:MAG: tRNA (guanosine(46)-N7)-methyltransferase TrmB [Rikenellaceae bacterium]
MGKDKIKRFQENETFDCMVQPLFEDIFGKDHFLKGRWREDFFKNNNPIVLELGCGRGEYTIGLAKMNSMRNYIGIDVKGARMWRGGRTATDEEMKNVAFIRTRIEFINSFFAKDEIDEIWITFPDPQLKKNRVKKRLTGAEFLTMYSKFLSPEGTVNLKTDSQHLHLYTREVIKVNELRELVANNNIYATTSEVPSEVTALKTTYEARYLAEGKPITYLKFQLKQDFTYISPDFAADDEL